MPYEPIDNFRENVLDDRSSYPIRDAIGAPGTWNNPLKSGDYSIWLNGVDSKIYKKEGNPINDNDGIIVNLED